MIEIALWGEFQDDLYDFFSPPFSPSPNNPAVNLEGELTSPFQRSLPLAASPSRAGYEPTPCDQGGTPPWIP